MTDNILMHPITATQAVRYIDRPSNAIILVGPDGIGKTYLAEHLLAALLGGGVSSLRHKPYYYPVEPDTGNVITIDAIRDLRQKLRLKTTGKGEIRRAVLIEHAQAMTQEAQNAFLKLLEEPPLDTAIIMTVNSHRALLSTIMSRVQRITVHMPSEAELKMFFSKTEGRSMSVDQAYLLSGGLPGLMSALLKDDASHPLASSVNSAKNLLRLTSFERYVEIDSLSKRKDEAAAVITAMQHIAHTGIYLSTIRDDQPRLKQWHRIYKASVGASKAMQNNANTKLILCELVAGLS